MQKLQKEIKFEIESGIDNHRDSFNVKTQFATTEFTNILQELLQRKHELSMVDKIEANGWDPKKQAWIKFGKTPSPGYIANWFYCQQLQEVIGGVPLGYKYRLKFFQVNGCSDTAYVRRVVMRDDHTHRTPIYEEKHFGQEMFAVSAFVVPYNNSICIAHVALMVVYPDPNTKTSKENRAGIVTIDDSKTVASTSVPGAEWTNMVKDNDVEANGSAAGSNPETF